MPVVYNGGQTPLELAAIAARKQLLPINTYNNASVSNEYTSTHTRAIADTSTPHYGKGTGNFLDIQNYNAGSDWDIFGNQSNSLGSGRNPAFTLNSATFGYDPTHKYLPPNTSLNIGQVII
jgi:hypothetical protein